MIIRPTSLSINQLFGSTNEQYVIPTYQRRYSWHERQVWELIDDIKLIDEDDTHLLGSIVCLTGPHTAGLNKLELVDGQQRLTTITILLECIRQRLAQDEGETDRAAEVGRLLSARPLEGAPLRKVALDSIDSEEFNWLVENDPVPEFKNQHLRLAFSIIREWVRVQNLIELERFLYRLTNQAVVIRLDVSESKDAFKLFETINNRGLRLSPSDIIKNFLLGNAARFGEDALKSARESWARLIIDLDGTNSDAFFRYYLMAHLRVRITTAKVVTEFKTMFMCQVIEAKNLPERHLYPDAGEPTEDEADDASVSSNSSVSVNKSGPISFKDFLARLVNSAKVYGELVLFKTNDLVINRSLRNLHMIKAVQTYGFLMHLRVSDCSDRQFREVLKITESFVLRRHVCRERANDTEGLFARLCIADLTDPVENTRSEYRALCPSDDKFREEFASTNFPASLIDRARYCLEQIEMAMHGRHDELQVLGPDDVHVEHIIPQKITTKKAQDEFGDWATYLGDNAETLHPKYVSRIGNLTIFSGTLNIIASNNPFMKKKEAYMGSGIKLTQDVSNMPQFKFNDVKQRSDKLAGLAVELWPIP